MGAVLEVAVKSRRRSGRSKWKSAPLSDSLRTALAGAADELSYLAQSGRQMRVELTVHHVKDKPEAVTDAELLVPDPVKDRLLEDLDG